MKLKNPIWSFVILFLALLPSAFAQTAGSSWMFIGINALVIALVLFVLQAFLIPKKDPNEKSATWIVVVVASLVIAWFYGNSGYIWDVGPLSLIFNRFALVNALLIGAVIYFGLGFLKVGNLNSPEGNAGKAILIFLVSIVIAVKIGPTWIWSQPMVTKLIDFLFHPDAKGVGGILNPFDPYYKLWIFVSLFTLLAFFLNQYLMKDKEGKVNYALALLLSGHMAYYGVQPSSVIIIGEIIFLLIFERALTESVKRAGVRWMVSAVIVLWASYAISSATGHYGISGFILGKSSGVGSAAGGIVYGIGWIFKAFVILILGVLAYMGIKKAFDSIGTHAVTSSTTPTTASTPATTTAASTTSTSTTTPATTATTGHDDHDDSYDEEGSH